MTDAEFWELVNANYSDDELDALQVEMTPAEKWRYNIEQAQRAYAEGVRRIGGE